MEHLDFVFQIDSDIAKEIYNEADNYLIEYSDTGERNVCAIYFSSNGIYFPNTEEELVKRIVNLNFFEWYNTRIKRSSKLIFVRDIFKQWYLAGINADIDSPTKLVEFLKEETAGYEEIITIGGSAGGYAAILYGSLINANVAYSFNPQFEIFSLLRKSNELIDPLIFRLYEQRNQYYDIRPFINKNLQIIYFYSIKSQWDIEQRNHIGDLPNLYRIPFASKHHGIPFPKVAMSHVLNSNLESLQGHVGQIQHPICFTIREVGFFSTCKGLALQIFKVLKKKLS